MVVVTAAVRAACSAATWSLVCIMATQRADMGAITWVRWGGVMCGGAGGEGEGAGGEIDKRTCANGKWGGVKWICIGEVDWVEDQASSEVTHGLQKQHVSQRQGRTTRWGNVPLFLGPSVDPPARATTATALPRPPRTPPPRP